MCTLIAVHRRVHGKPLLVAANRDEYLDRPAEGLSVRQTRAGRLVAPLDVRAGGTWLGLSDRGVFAALTNLRTETPDPNGRSRGEIVVDALAGDSAESSVQRLLEDLRGERKAESDSRPEERRTYNPFNLFVADEDTAWVIVHQTEATLQRLEAGVHVIGNVEAIGPPNEKVQRIRDEAEAALERSERKRDGEALEGLGELCRHHEHASDPLFDTCVHVKGTHGGVVYGTRSSMLLELETGFRAGRLLQTDGPPCEKDYQDVSSLLHDLRQRPAGVETEPQVRTAS